MKFSNFEITKTFHIQILYLLNSEHLKIMEFLETSKHFKSPNIV
jgi:hypothetical protein